MPATRASILVAGLAALAATVLVAAPQGCTDCLTAHYWLIPPGQWNETGNRPPFPEDDYLTDPPDQRLGLAFSGGGTRSATATLGQLRGLNRNGWLEHVSYISAVSGGAWAAIPFTYTKRPIDEFLGTYEDPDTLTVDAVKDQPNGSLARAIANSSLVASGLPEGAAIAANAYNEQHSGKLLLSVLSITNKLRRESDRLDKTYARLLGSVFIDGKKNEELIEPGTTNSTRLFSWNTKSADGMSNNGQLGDFVVAGVKRPFLIASGTMVSMRHDYEYPLLMPVEYTPLYVGVRQQFGRFGGSYVWPWAYDPVAVRDATPSGTTNQGTVSVQYDDAHRFTLADVAASTGAAPELAVVLGASLPQPYQSKVQLGAQVFPAFKHFAVRGPGPVTLTEQLPHADGGASDNLAVMPLLARRVTNIVVFINTDTRYVENNDDLRSLFLPVNPPNLSGDKRHNVVFDEDKHAEVVEAIAKARAHGDAQVYCEKSWNVKRNDHYNIQAYSGLNICYVYNASSLRWEEAFKSETARTVLALIKGKPTSKGDTRNLDDFPWFRTFGQNKPHLIQLTATQVNLLSNLTAWTMANPTTAVLIRNTMDPKILLPCPPDVACGP
jgi:hypothetical protein